MQTDGATPDMMATAKVRQQLLPRPWQRPQNGQEPFLTMARTNPFPYLRTWPILLLPLFSQDSSSTKIPFQFCVWIQVSRELKILQIKMRLSSFTMISGILQSHVKPSEENSNCGMKVDWQAASSKTTMSRGPVRAARDLTELGASPTT